MKYKPMLASLGNKEDSNRPNMYFEPKLDGYRALCYVTKNSFTLYSRNGLNITAKYPELAIRNNIQATQCILDGEIVVYNNEGVPEFSLLQNHTYEVTYVVFDILEKNNTILLHKPLSERKKILENTIKPSEYIETTAYTQNGPLLLEKMKKLGFEGVMAKKIQSHYYPGKRVKTWLKIKFTKTIDAVIIGYTQQKRNLSSLALGVYDTNKNLVYIGKVGTGFSEKKLRDLYTILSPLKRKTKPIKQDIKDKSIIWVQPKKVCEVKFNEVTKDLKLRAPVFVTLRFDKPAKECSIKQLSS